MFIMSNSRPFDYNLAPLSQVMAHDQANAELAAEISHALGSGKRAARRLVSLLNKALRAVPGRQTVVSTTSY